MIHAAGKELNMYLLISIFLLLGIYLMTDEPLFLIPLLLLLLLCAVCVLLGTLKMGGML